MAKLWIVHRDPRWRDALVAMADPLDVLAGEPNDAARFDATQPPRAVLLGVGGDFEAELEFAHRMGPRLAGTAWVLLARPLDAAEVTRLFDALPATLVPISVDIAVLRRRLRAALARRPAAALSARTRRDALTARFARWFGDLELPELFAAIDPSRASASLVVRGEPGTGRALLARYLHTMTAADASSPFAAVACTSDANPLALLASLVPETGELPSASALTVCLEDVDQLAPPAQRLLRSVIEGGAPTGQLRAARVRWIATAADPRGADDDLLGPDLARALAGLTLRIPPLRERPDAIEATALTMARDFTASRREPERRFAPAAIERLRGHPWPGNHRELEAVIRSTLVATSADPIEPGDLRFERLDLVLTGDPQPAGSDAPREAAERSVPANERSLPDEVAPELPDFQAAPQPARRAPAEDDAIRRLSAAVAHEVGNPLVGIRTYAAILPSRFDDPAFRSQFTERVETDIKRIEAVLETLARLGGLAAPAREPVDVSSLLAQLLERERPRIRERRLVVLEELDRAQPCALGDAEHLRFALGLLFEQAIGWMPERGDLYVATRHQDAGREGVSSHPEPKLRILLRFRAPWENGLGFGENALAVSAVEAVVRAHDGAMAIESSTRGEASIVIELPAPQEGVDPLKR